MQLARPQWLWLLAVVPLMALWAAWGRVRRRRDWAALGSSGKPPRDGSFLWLAAVVFLATALARPRWGASEYPPLPEGRDIVIAVDVSRSMGAEDAVPDRLAVAVESAESLVRALGRSPGDRVAVVAFAGRGVRRCPLTEMLGAVVDTLQRLEPGDVRPGGTDLGSALDAAREAFDDQDHAGGRTVVLFSDGEDHPDHWRSALDRVKNDAIIVHTVAVGDPERGAEVLDDAGDPLKFEGKTVVSTRTDKALRTIAEETGGAFIPLGITNTDMGALYRSRIEPVAASRRLSRRTPELSERFGIFLLLGLTLAVAACRPTRRRRSFGALGRHAFGAAALLCFLGATAGEDPAALIEKGREDYVAGRIEDALTSFRKAIDLAPRRAVPRYDAAATLFRLGRFDEAEVLYREAREFALPPLRTKIDYALGNTMIARGDMVSAIRFYDECLASKTPGVDLDRVRKDAAVNKKFAEDLLRRKPPDPNGEPPDESPPEKTESRGQPSAERKKPAPSPTNSGEEPSPGLPTGRRGQGGAGGGGKAPPLPGSPEDQLAKAVDDVKRARSSRLPDDEIPHDPGPFKDW